MTRSSVAIKLVHPGAVAEQADAADLKSAGGDTLWVQVPPALLDIAKDRVTKLQNATMPVDYCMLAGVPHAKNES